MESNRHKILHFPYDVGLPPALLKHVSDRSEFILKHFKIFVKNLYGICMESNCHTFHIMNLYGIKFSFYGKDPGPHDLIVLINVWPNYYTEMGVG